jgi:secreted trypsin-like serine protease
MPATRALTSERIAGGISAKKGAWPFMVSWYIYSSKFVNWKWYCILIIYKL